MKTRLTDFLQVTLKLFWFISLILILVHIVFIVLGLLNLKMPAISGTKFIEYPIQVFKTESDSRHGTKSIDGTLTSFENDAFGLVLQNRKDSTDRLQITTVTSSLTVDPSSNRDILIVIFLKRIIYLLIFFICIFQLEKLFLAFKKNQPFDLKNVKRINIIAYMIISISPVTSCLTSLLFYYLMTIKFLQIIQLTHII